MMFDKTQNEWFAHRWWQRIFVIFTGVLERDIFASSQFLRWLDCKLRIPIDLMKVNGFSQKEVRNRRHPTESTTDTDYIDHIRFFAYTNV